MIRSMRRSPSMTLVVSATECLLSPQVSTATVYPSSGAADNTGILGSGSWSNARWDRVIFRTAPARSGL
jgi:hypothetical protein